MYDSADNETAGETTALSDVDIMKKFIEHAKYNEDAPRLASHKMNLEKIKRKMIDQLEHRIPRLPKIKHEIKEKEFSLRDFYEFLIDAGEGDKVE